MSKVELNPKTYIFPLPTVLMGADVNGKPNYNTIGNCGIMRLAPPIIYVSSSHTHYTNKGVFETNGFSVNLPSTKLTVETDYCGIVSGNKSDKSKVFNSFYGKLENVPMIEECPVNLECRLVQTLDIHGMDVFIGEIMGVYADEQCLTNGVPDIKKVDPVIFSITGGGYWKVGDRCGSSYSDGKQYNFY